MQKFILSSDVRSILLGMVGLGLVTLMMTFYISPDQGWLLLLAVICFLFTVSVSGGFFTALQFIAGAKWSVAIRRIPETMVYILPITFLFMIALFFSLSHIYEWAHYEHCTINHDCTGLIKQDTLLDAKAWYLNTPFFISRVVLYFVMLYMLGRMMHKKSLVQDDCNPTERVAIKDKLVRMGAGYMVGMAYLLAFFSIDVVMSLEPHWYSSMFPIYVFSGAAYSGISAWIILLYVIQYNNGLKQVTVEHYHDLGKFLLMFTIFWAYIAFSQFMLIWYTNLPEETIYLERRLRFTHKNFFGLFTILFWVGHFIVPFIVLLSRQVKRKPKVLCGIACWCLFMGFMDIIWSVYGGFNIKNRFPVSWNEIGAFMGSVGLFGYVFFHYFAKSNELPVGDVDLQTSLHFHQPH